MYWLFKEEPTHYSYDDLLKEKKTSWTGVHNNLALKYLRQVKKGDMIFYYHTGEEKQIVGVMKALTDAKEVAAKEGKEVSVDVAPVERLPVPVTLHQMKEDKRFAGFLLLKISRLSVMPVSEELWKAIVSYRQ